MNGQFLELYTDYLLSSFPYTIATGLSILLDIDFNQISVGVNDENSLPQKNMLYQNYPNPFNPSTTIKYSIAQNNKGIGSDITKLIIYNVLGKKLVTLVNKRQSPGNYSVSFDGSKLSSGVYFYKLTSGNFSRIKKMLLLF